MKSTQMGRWRGTANPSLPCGSSPMNTKCKIVDLFCRNQATETFSDTQATWHLAQTSSPQSFVKLGLVLMI